jgi:predicted transcriptional regulator
MRYKASMDALETVNQLEARAHALGLGTAELCKLAGIAPSTFNRWKAGETSPTFATISKVESVLAARSAPAPIEAAE